MRGPAAGEALTSCPEPVELLLQSASPRCLVRLGELAVSGPGAAKALASCKALVNPLLQLLPHSAALFLPCQLGGTTRAQERACRSQSAHLLQRFG